VNRAEGRRTSAAVNRPVGGTGLPPCHAGIDVGTSAVKAVLVEPDGRVSARSRVPLPADAGGERDSLDWLDGTRAALAQLPDQERARVCSVGLTGLTPGTVLVDEAGHPTVPALTWQHSAATAEAAELAARFGDTAELLGTSLPWGPGYPPAQLAWLARRRPQARAATRWVLQAKDFVGMALTGSPASDRWSSKGICNILTGAPAAAILRAAGWDPAVCPPTAEPWEPRGTVTAEASDRFGIPAGVPVSVGWSDALGGMLALGVFERPRAFAILGTSCIAGVSLAPGTAAPGSGAPGTSAPGTGAPGTGAAGSGLLNVPATVAPLALAYGPTQNGGSALDWLAALTGRDVPELMELSEQADLAATPVFAPYLAGERAPLWEAGARGVLTGLVTATGAAELGRATLRGIAATVRNVIEHAERAADRRYPAVIVGGSMAGHPAWLTAAHEVLGREFSVTDDEPSGYGAAMCGASAAGFSLPPLAAHARRPLAGAASADESFAQFIAATDVSLAAVRRPPAAI
jgi:xylulokinase